MDTLQLDGDIIAYSFEDINIQQCDACGRIPTSLYLRVIVGKHVVYCKRCCEALPIGNTHD